MDFGQMLLNLKKSSNPQQFVLNFVESNLGNNPFFANLIALAKENKTQEMENIARNVFKEKGLDYDSELNKMKKTMGF